MAQVYADGYDGWFRLTDSSSWANARGTVSSSSSAGSNTASSYSFAVYNYYSAGRGGATFYCGRSYFAFDLSGESGTATSVSLKVYADNEGTAADEEASFYVVGATALAGATADYGNCFTSGTTLGTNYGLGQASTTEGYATVNLNSAGVSAVNSAIGSGTLTIGCLGWYDYNNTAPSLGGDYTQLKFTFTGYTGTSRDPYLDITYATAATDNAVFFGCNF